MVQPKSYVFMIKSKSKFEDVTPQPEDFIKSISEQGYRLETAIADLIDNSISAGANKVEVLLDTETQPFTLYLADNGNGMNSKDLQQAMRLPSSSVDSNRKKQDLGRFGLGLKTASFSQTRCFSMVSREKNTAIFHSRTWDIEILRKKGWSIKIDSHEEILKTVKQYKKVSSTFLNSFDGGFKANTIVVWKGIHKFEGYIKESNCADVIKRELTEVTKEHLSIVFHRFMEKTKNGLEIRLNNIRVTPFNPFPVDAAGVRGLEMKNRKFGSDSIKVEGFILPTNSVDAVKQGSSIWAPPRKSLSDMEGIYVYRADRVILFGGWLNLTRRSPRIQLARMRVEIGNTVDHLLHLNVSKSQVEIPHDLRAGLSDYVSELKGEAEREYLNRSIQTLRTKVDIKKPNFIKTTASNRGALVSVNTSFPLIGGLMNTLSGKQITQFKAIMRMFNKEMNSIRKVHQDAKFIGAVEEEGLDKLELIGLVKGLLNEGFEPSYIKTHVIKQLGFEVTSLPDEVMNLLEKGQ